VSPLLPEPVPAVYVVLAFVPVSMKSQPVGTAVDVPVLARELKSSAKVVSSAEMLIVPAAEADGERKECEVKWFRGSN
jgi:hypothetical protein